MKVNIREREGIVIFDLEGEFTLLHSQVFREAFDQRFDNNTNKIILNFKDVVYIDSSGIGALISAFSAVKKIMGKLALVNIPEVVMDIFERARLLMFFEVFDREEEAVSSMSKD